MENLLRTAVYRFSNALAVLIGKSSAYENALHAELDLLRQDRDNLMAIIRQKVNAEFELFEEGVKTLRSNPTASELEVQIKKDTGTVPNSVSESSIPTPEDDTLRQ